MGRLTLGFVAHSHTLDAACPLFPPSAKEGRRGCLFGTWGSLADSAGVVLKSHLSWAGVMEKHGLNNAIHSSEVCVHVCGLKNNFTMDAKTTAAAAGDNKADKVFTSDRISE